LIDIDPLGAHLDHFWFYSRIGKWIGSVNTTASLRIDNSWL